MNELLDTVAAVSTPRGKGGIAVIRISGQDARDILARVFAPIHRAATDAPRHACLGKIVSAAGDVIDEGLATFFPSPASFTGEDVVEIACHGGILLTEQVLTAVLAAGARPATAGEFTRRALLHGKMKLSAAEALGDLLEAKTEGQLELARGGMAGHLSRELEEGYHRLSALLADAYAKIDFPDEDLNTLSREELCAAFAEVEKRLERLQQTYRTGHAVGEGIATVICGPVNAGKSTLYNALVGKDAAIVTDVAGTTRDILSETVALGNVTLRLFDTAGLRDTDDTVEGIGVMRTREAMQSAELILAVLDGAKEPDAEVKAFLAELKGLSATVVAVLNKSDKQRCFPEELLADSAAVVQLCARERDTEALREAIERLYLADGITLGKDPVVSNARQHAALSRAVEALSRTVASLAADVPLDAACIDAELAMQALGEVDGRAVDESILADIFSHFCVGK